MGKVFLIFLGKYPLGPEDLSIYIRSLTIFVRLTAAVTNRGPQSRFYLVEPQKDQCYLIVLKTTKM